MKTALVIAARELRAYLTSPMAYLASAAFLLLSGAFFASYLAATEYTDTSVRGFVDVSPYLIMLLATVLTMRLVADERASGSWELLVTSQARDGEIVLGKFTAALAMLCAMLGLTLYFPALLVVFGDPDAGPIVIGYAAMVLLGAVSLAIGMFATACTDNQIVAAVIGGAVMFGLWMLGPLTSLLPAPMGELLAAPSTATHFPDLARGIADTKSLVYYLSLAALFLFLAVRVVEYERAGRRWRAPSVVGTLLACAVAVLMNLVSATLHARVDLTGAGRFTLTGQTRHALEELGEPVAAAALFSSDVPAHVAEYAERLLAEYRQHTRRLVVHKIDPVLHPDRARRWGLDPIGARYGAVVFRGDAGDRTVYGPEIVSAAEQRFTAAILEVTGTTQRLVTFLTGHGEHDPWGGYEVARTSLEARLYAVRTVHATAPGVFEAAAAVVVAGPVRAPSAQVLAKLSAYAASGGRLFLLLDPAVPPEWKQLTSEWGLEVGEGTLIDPASHVAPSRDNPLVPRDRNAFGLGTTYFPGAAGLIPRADGPAGVEMTALAWSSPDAYLDRDYAGTGTSDVDPAADAGGPLAIGALISSERHRVVVMGDSDFAAAGHFHNGANGELFVAAVDWLSEGTRITTIERKVLPTRRLLVTTRQARFIMVSGIGLLPTVVLVAGAVVWRVGLGRRVAEHGGDA